MALVQITPPAGIIKNGTDYANKGRFVDGDLVRFENGYLKPLGGWTFFRSNPVGTFFSGTVTTASSSANITVTTTVTHSLLVGDTIVLEDCSYRWHYCQSNQHNFYSSNCTFNHDIYRHYNWYWHICCNLCCIKSYTTSSSNRYVFL